MANYLGNIDLKREKTPSIEQKIANIMGTTTSQVRALSDELSAQRKAAEEAAKKAAQEAAARAKAEAALAAQRSAAAAAQSEAARVANAKAIKQRLSAGLKKPAQTSAAAQAVDLASAFAAEHSAQAKEIKQAVALDYQKNHKQTSGELKETALESTDSPAVPKKQTRLDQLLEEGNTGGLTYEAERAQAQADVAEAALRNSIISQNERAYELEQMREQVAKIRSKAKRTAQEEELLRQYAVKLDLYNKTAGLVEKRTGQYQDATDAKAVTGHYAQLGSMAEKYSEEIGAELEAKLAAVESLEEVWLYGGTPEYLVNNYSRLSTLAAEAGMDVKAYVADIQENYKTYLREAKAEYATWSQGRMEYDIELTLHNMSDADEYMFRELIDYTSGTNEGNIAYSGKATGRAAQFERTLKAKYGDDYERVLDRMNRRVNAEKRAEQVEYIKSASGLDKVGLSILSVGTNLVSAPGVLFEYAFQAAEAGNHDYYSPIDTNAAGFHNQNWTQDIRGITAQELEKKYGKAASFLYTTTMSGIDSFVSGAAFGASGGMVLGATAAANTMQDITERGGTIGQAIVGGIAAGVFETLFETVSIGNMQAMRKSAFAATGIDDLFSLKNLKTLVGNIAKETGVNFTEEAATEIANILYDTAALGDLSNYQIRIQELMTQDPALTEAQAKKIVASELGVQVLEAGLSGALMGAAFGAIDTSIAAYNQIENVKQLASARKLAATLPEAYRPGFDAANVTNETAAAYAVEVYLAAQRYNKAQQETQSAAKTQQEAESTAQAQQAMEEKAAVNVTTFASAQQVYEAQQEAHAQAQAETGAGEAAQDSTAISGYGNAENAVAGEAGNINGGETESDVRARGEVAQLAQAFAGEELIQAVGDLANDRRMAGDAQGAAALEKALAGYQAGVYTGENEGGTADGREVYLRDGGEWNDGADSGGAVRSVAESTGRDPGGDLPGNGGRPAGAGGDAPGNQGAYRTVQGSTRQVTGFGNGEVSDSVGLFEQLPPELEDLRQQVVKNGYSVRFTDGVMQFGTKRGTATVDGVYANGGIVVNARSAKWAPEQLVNHEMFHGFARENDGLVDAMVAKVFGDLSDAEIEEIVAKYQEAYKGAGLSRQQALEEICADAFAGMDRKNIGLAGRMSAAREFVGQQTGAQAATGMGTATRAGRASPISTQTGKAAGSVAGGFVRGESESFSINKAFSDELQEWNGEGRPDNETFVLGSTGSVLQGIGAIESDIYLLGDKIKFILSDHPEMTLNEIEKIPEILENPVLVLKSRNAERGNRPNTRLVLFGTAKATNGLPVMTVLDLRPHNKGFFLNDMQKLDSAYTKTNNPTWFVSNSEVLYADKKRTMKLLKALGFQMPSALQNLGSVGTISYNKRSVNMAGIPFQQLFSANGKQAILNLKPASGANSSIRSGKEKETSEPNFSIAYTQDNTPFVEVEEDILDGVPEADWVRTVKQNLKQKFPNGISVGNHEIKIDRRSRSEMTFSKYMQRLYNTDSQLYEDKLRATNNADEIILASQDWVNEGQHHARKDSIRDFARGKVLLRVGTNDYTANVVVGTRNDGTMLLYDILNLKPASFTKKKKDTAIITANPSPGTDSHAVSFSNTTIAQTASGVNSSIRSGNANETEAEEIPDGEEIAEGVYETSFSVAEDIQNRGKLFYAQSYAKVKASAENRALLNAAKAGNTRAAADFVDALIRDAYYRKVQENYTGATLAPLIGAAGSTNVLPEIFAERISRETGLPVLRELMKTSVNHMRNKSRANRQKQRLEFTFTGMPDYSFAGRHYVVVDDVVSTGTTMNALAEWIMERGGIVDGYLALAKGIQNVVSLEADAQALAGLTGRYGSDALLAAVQAYGLGERLEDLTRGEIRQLEMHPELFGLAAGGGESDMRFSAAQDAYTYDTLIGKPDMPVTVVDDTAKYSPDKATRKTVLDTAIKNAASVGHTNANGNAVIHVEDTDTDVILSRNGLGHGLDRRLAINAPIVVRAGEILKHAIQINQLNPRTENVSDTYVLVGAAKNTRNEPYIVSFVVNRYTSEVDKVDVLYAVNAKTEPAGSLSPGVQPKNGLRYLTDSTLSIAELLEYVNRYFPDVLSMDVLAHFGHSERPEGTLGESAMFSPAAGTDYDAQIREYDEKIESLELEAAGGDEAARGALIAARLNRSALMQQREAAQAEQKPEAPTAMQKAALAQIAGLEKQIAENKAKQKAEQTKYKKDGKAAHLKEAQRLKQLVTRQRARVRQIKKDAGIQAEPGAESGRRVFRPTQTIRQTENRILDLFRIQAGSRAGMRGELHSILERILMDGYVGDRDVDRALRAMYEAGREVLPAADPVYEDIAKGLRGKKIYVSDEVRAEFGEDWNGVRQQLWGRGIYTSTDIRESGIDSIYAGLAGEYPGLFDEDNTDMRGMLEEILEAAQLGRAVHWTLGEAAEARGLTSGEEFEALTGEVMRELSKFADTADVESRMRERTAQELERQRGQYAEARRKAAERRAVAEQMRRIRSSLNRLNRRARVNDQILSRTMSMQDEATQEIMRQAQAQISTVANRITGKKMQNLLELKRVYEEAQAENPNFLPNPATEKALERVGQVHLQDLSVDELHTLYEAVKTITHDLETQDELIGKVWDDQLDHAADGLEQEIEFSHGAKGEGKLAKLYNEESLSPSRALLRLVGYDRSGIMGKIVKEFEDGDIAAMEYAVGADKIFADFMKKNGDWLKTAAGKKAKVVEVEVPRILAWGEGDAPIYDENGPKTVKIKLTQMMLVQMALDARNEDNLRHIQYGGYSLPDMDRLKAGKTGSAYAKGEHVRGVKLAPEVLRRIVEENLDAQGKEYALLLHRYYNQFSKDRINRTSRMLDGVDRAMTRDYYPMQSDQGYLPKQYNVFDGTLEGMGSLKERQSGARNAIILGEADATMRWHRDNMARYVGYAVAKRNFEKLLNYRSSRGITIRESIKEKWGVNADAFLSDFMQTVEEGSLENVPDILSSITGNYVGSVLGFNIASMMKQLGAIPMAATKLGTGAMAVGLFRKGKSRDFILKYTPYLESRGKGYTYTEIADYSRKHEGRPSNRFMQTITGQNWLTAMDTAVNKAMWGAAEWYVSHQTNLRPGKQEDIDAGTDLFYQKVAEVFDRATHDTQTNYNLMSRPFALQRKGLRPFVMFRTDAYQAVGMIREAVGAWDTQVKHLKAADGLATKESVNEAGKLAVRAVLGVVSSNVLSAGIDLVRALLRGNDEEYEDEEGKLDLFRMGKDVARNTLINLLGGVVFVDTVAEFVDSQLNGDYFFAPELMGVASAEDFAGSIAEFVKTVGKSIGDLNALAKADGDTGAYLERQAEELAGAARDIALAVSQIFGLPLKNMERAVTTGLGLIYPGAKVAYNAVFSDVAKADLAGLEGDALVQGMAEYMRDELLFADEKVCDELVRLYGIYGAQILPGANAPTTRKLDDETEQDLTVAEMGEWDAEYLRTMQKQLPEMIGSTYYKSLSDDEKKAVLTSLNRFAAGTARKRIGMEPDAWVANVLEAGENGAEISDTVVYRALANMLESDRDEEGKAISGSVLKKKIDLLDGMALTDREREAILGAFEQSEGEQYALAVKNGLKWDEYAEMVAEGWGSAENYNKLIDDGVAHDTALDLLEVKAGLEPEEGKTSVTNAQIYEAIAAADMTEAERYDAIGAVLGLDSKGYDKMRVVQDTGLRAADYAALRGAEQEDQYLDAVELGMTANTAYAVVSAVAALPKLPEGERYTDAQRQAAACGACKSTAEQIDAYILYGNATYKTAEKAKLAVAAENYGVTPQMVLEFKELLARHDANGNGSYDKAEKKAALEASGFTRQQKRALWQLHDPDSKSNPFGGAWDIRDAYEEAKEKEKAEKKN